MSTVQFRILCPNGRKVAIKTHQTKPLLLLIEEACEKQGYTPENYDLKHLRRILDPTVIVRYANIPNNAQLELVEAETPRQLSTVSVTLATSSGRRLVHDFSSNASLWEILLQHVAEFSSEEGLIISEETEPVIVYTMQKISGEKLKSTTLKSLGLLSGKCLLRYSKESVQKAASSQPHVSSITNPRKPTKEDETTDTVSYTEVQRSSVTQSGGVRSSNASEAVLSSLRNVSGVTKQPQLTAYVEVPKHESSSVVVSHIENENTSEQIEDICMESPDEEEVTNGESSEHNLIRLCDGNVFLFSEDDIPATNYSKEEDDSFYEVTINEAKKMYTDLVNKRRELEDAPLMTGPVRELEKHKRVLATLNAYPETQLRIYFPDRYVIQALFKPYNTIYDVITLLRPFLAEASLDFYLYTLFPRTKLEPEVNLVDAGCTPKCRVYFGTDKTVPPPYLKEEVIAKKSTFKAVCKAAEGNR